MIRIPGDKSISHRALLLSALARGESRLSGLLPGADCRSTAAVLRSLGQPLPPLPRDGAELRVQGVGAGGLGSPREVLDCGNSGTTARLLLGFLSGLPVEAVLTGDASLRSRPMRRVTEPLARMGARFREEGEEDRLPIRLSGGGLRPLTFTSPVASAQVKSALLLAGVTGGVPVEVHEPHRSRDHTERMLRRMGARVEEGPSGEGWRVALEALPEALSPLDLHVPGDFSSAAFVLALALLAGPEDGLRIGNVGLNPTRTGLLDVLEEMGARIQVESLREADGPAGEPAADLLVRPSALRGILVGGEVIPRMIDEIPVLAVLAARAEGVTEIRDAGELRVKESDRIRSLAGNLSALGVEVAERPDGLRIRGNPGPLRGRVRAHDDHRIAMAFGILDRLPDHRVAVDDPGVVEVSFPGFWELLAAVPSTEPPPPRREPPVITIDGPAASGKSSTAGEVARRLGLRHLNSGDLYRALTLALLRSGIPEEAWDRLDAEDLRRMDVELEPEGGGFRVLLDGEPAGEALRSAEVTGRVSHVAGLPAVRTRLRELQHRAVRFGGVVADGRDMGTVIFPRARLKIYLTASPEARARRRLRQEGRDEDPGSVREEVLRIRRRDEADSSRAHAPLRRPDDALALDTTDLTFAQQVEAIVEAARGLTPGRGEG